jgi:Pentapeptide repeats (8 copies)
LSDAHARLFRANLTNAHLDGADLDDARLNGANLTNAHLTNARLRGANLRGADLTGADLTGAQLSCADFSFSNVADADFDFDPDSPPKAVPGIYTAENLQLVKFLDQPAGLVKLRSELKDLGMRTQEAQFTYAIRRSELSRKTRGNYYSWSERTRSGSYVHSWSERAFNTVFFDWTCQYGMSPGRPLLIVAALVVMLSMVYIFAQVDPGPNGGIWAVWDEHRIKQGEGGKEPQQLTDGFPSGRSQISFLLLAFYFSLLSATRIGWHELNVGIWITRIQPRQYSLQATGWVRVVSGVQSLISVYLVALAILTYFGTPFEY